MRGRAAARSAPATTEPEAEPPEPTEYAKNRPRREVQGPKATLGDTTESLELVKCMDFVGPAGSGAPLAQPFQVSVRAQVWPAPHISLTHSHSADVCQGWPLHSSRRYSGGCSASPSDILSMCRQYVQLTGRAGVSVRLRHGVGGVAHGSACAPQQQRSHRAAWGSLGSREPPNRGGACVSMPPRLGHAVRH